VLVVHSADGMDEVSIGAATHVAELKEGSVTTYSVTPESFGLARGSIANLAVESAADSLAVIRTVFNNQAGAARDIVALNAGAAIYTAGLVASWQAGIAKALAVLDDGSAQRKFNQFITFTNSF
ncbi:MAG: anthranilate phosphoribosyltransferase, partial [Halothiobacillaceae bacterium]